MLVPFCFLHTQHIAAQVASKLLHKQHILLLKLLAMNEFKVMADSTNPTPII
jgi:hypothetical protein